MRYAELRPEQLDAAIRQIPVAVWPIGALEWHGSHLPLGLDGLVAEAFGQRLQEVSGGVLLPALWHPITTLPHPYSLDIPTSAFRDVVSSTAGALAQAGFRVLCIVTGHYAQGHSLELYQLAAELSDRLAVIAASPLEPLEEEDLLDHAGQWETAQLLALRPELVRLDELPGSVNPRRHGVLGGHPRNADPDLARKKADEALDVWRRWIEQALSGDHAEVSSFYSRRSERYRSYAETYFRESWEQAIRDWWSDQA